MFRRNCCVILAVAVVTASPRARADTLYISSGGNPLPYSDVKILGMSNGQILYNTESGNEASKPVEEVVRMQIDDEPALNTAEQAFFTGKWDDAVDGYENVIRSTNKPWLKDWATLRLLTAAQKSSRFDAATTAYIAVLLRDPDHAAKYRPQMPEAGSSYLDGAISDATAALNTVGLNDRQKPRCLASCLTWKEPRTTRPPRIR